MSDSPSLHQFAHYAIYVLIALAVMFLIEGVYLWVSYQGGYRRKINKRLRILERIEDRGEALLELRRKHGLTSEGRYAIPLIAFNRLVTQSAIGTPIPKFLAYAALLGVLAAGLGYLLLRDLPIAGLSGLVAGLLLPLLYLHIRRKRRMARFETQFPDAIDVIIRCLKAGHPLPVAISMVASQFPDPAGTEFGIASDEMTYGLDIEKALHNLRERVGQSDLGFFVVAVALQSQTGGNLSEVLTNLSRTLRERFKMRRKVKALSAEGRFSAMALSILPIIVGGTIHLTAPAFYGDIARDPLVPPVSAVTAALWLTGIVIMYRMVNFKF